MSQTRMQSLTEAIISNASSFVMSWVGNMLLLPLFGMHPSWRQAFYIGVCFTTVFTMKSYLLRRGFNRWHR